MILVSAWYAANNRELKMVTLVQLNEFSGGHDEDDAMFAGLDDLDLAPVMPQPAAATVFPNLDDGVNPDDPTATVYVEDCPKCQGSGLYRGYSSRGHLCFKCEGRGKLAFKTSPAQRASGRASAAKAKDRKEDAKTAAIAEFKAEYPQIVAWWTGSTFPFANAMEDALNTFGHLTERQLAAALNCVAKLDAAKKARAEEAAKTQASAPTANIARIEASFSFAVSKGIAKPKLRLGAFKFSPAPASGVNRGAIYVVEKDSDTYLGKVVAGKFLRSRDCTDTQEAGVLVACTDPEAAAIAYGPYWLLRCLRP